jgi:hypothetical protein
LEVKKNAALVCREELPPSNTPGLTWIWSRLYANKMFLQINGQMESKPADAMKLYL